MDAERIRVALAVCAVLVGPAAPAASAQQPPNPDGTGSNFFVTIAARECPTYSDIVANRARNNIQESLRDLGPNSPYTSGQALTPDIEDAPPPFKPPKVAACTPITGWKFTLGESYKSGASVGPWGSLSLVTQPYTTDITTLASVPKRNDQGWMDATATIAGATTIELTAAQAARAAVGSRLWIQGGTIDDPVLFTSGPFQGKYAFGALRCAIDNYNGDNVEWIQFPAGARHAYCYAYYVSPPPTSGTITIRKALDERTGNATKTFTFEGNISYNVNEQFTLKVEEGVADEMTFYRAETLATDPPWTFREIVPSGWALSGLTCSAAGSQVTPSVPNASVEIRLVAGDAVTCTFTNTYAPQARQLLITKLTVGDVGTFPFEVQGDVDTTAAATTKEQNLAVEAKFAGQSEPGPKMLPAGSYLVSEELPAPTRAGHWEQRSASCNPVNPPVGGPSRRTVPPPIPVELTATKGAVCVFENRFVPTGAITILKETRGAAGTTGFVINSTSGPPLQFEQTAVTDSAGDVAPARGERARRLPLGRYVIQETAPMPQGDGRWVLVAVTCGGTLRPHEQGRVEVELTRDNPRLVCRFVNQFIADVPPVPGPPPPEPPTPDAEPDLVVTKRALQGSVRFGDTAVFAITVRNVGDAAAEQVVLADGPDANAQAAGARASRGSCGQRVRVFCRLGRLDPGEEVTVRVRVRAIGTPRLNNVAVGGSASLESRLSNNADRARMRVRGAGGALGICVPSARGGRAGAGARARVAC